MKKLTNKIGKIVLECMMDTSNPSGPNSMEVKSLKINNIGGIADLSLDHLNPQMNIICGENGVGKTNILNSIALCFSRGGSQHDTRSKIGSENSSIAVETVNPEIYTKLVMQSSKPDQASYGFNNNKFYEDDIGNNLLYLKTNRHIQYQKLTSLSADQDQHTRGFYNATGINNSDVKDWFVKRILYKGVDRALTATQLKNLELSKQCFSILNDKYKFDRIDSFNEIYLDSPNGPIYLEYLSSGFKSVLFILLGIIKEIDYRLFESNISAEDYDGIILIDEIELHLHPEWQGKICSALKETFPKAQFFITTHSPHVIQTASANEVIALEKVGDEVIKRDLPVSEYGYRGWTVEEILKDVMGMRDLRTEEYELVRKEFVNAFKHQNYDEAKQAFAKIEKMLHPSSELKTIYQMQLDSLGD